jgi:glycerol-3-phosphate dehydrogenase subunit C
VDMALIKAEYLAQRFSATGTPLRNRLFASVPELLARFPKVGRLLIRWRNRHQIPAQCADRLLGISAGVKLPEPAEQPFSAASVRDKLQNDTDMPEVVLFIDTFNRHFNPAVAEAAVSVLAAAGYRIHLLAEGAHADAAKRPLCCGRTYFANGMIAEARQEARRLLQALAPHLEAERWIIGLEPSCILSLRDEYLSMGLGEQARQLAAKVVLLEEFIAREQTAKRWTLTFNALGRQKLLIHGHCHQKAVGATKAMRKVLKLIPELDSEQIESSCCGMAGQFGLESEHAGVSREMAEQGLFPALRAEPDATVVANGFSCQQQILNGGYAKPLHIAEILYAALGR